MPRPLARSLPRAAALHLLSVVPPRPDRHPGRGAQRCTQRAPYGRGPDRTPAARPRDYAALSLATRRTLKASTLRDCGRRCVYCAAALAADTVTLDHVYPRSKGGPNVAGNLVAACAPCNRLKADLLPAEFFFRHPWAGLNFVRYARTVHRALKRGARRAVSLACAAEADALPAAA